MKLIHRKILGFIMVSSVFLASIAWSPTSPDQIVQVGSNTTTGPTYSIGNPPETVNISSFRGFIGGNGSVVGTAGYHAVVVGSNNFGNAYSSVVCGSQNRFALTGNQVATSVRIMGLFGSYNVIANENHHLLVSGYGNTVDATKSFVAGSNNTISGLNNEAADFSSAIGYFNQIAAPKGWAMGDTNLVSADGGMALGTGLHATEVRSTALGRYNDGMEPGDVLVIGSGSDNTTRFTALSVTNDGRVILGQANGDISMGDYGN